MLVDLCCGTKKRPGATAVDWKAQPGVDVVHDLNVTPWPIPSNSVSSLFCAHGLEHLQDVPSFMREAYRVLQPEGELQIVTPHFSCYNSYADPTHLRHLSAFWFRPFVTGGYLHGQDCAFDVKVARVTFCQNIRGKAGKLLVRIRGLERWERTSAFRYPAMDVHTTLIAKKSV